MQIWPGVVRHKPAFVRAYKGADLSNNGFITEDEFANMLNLLVYYDQLYDYFAMLDADKDGRVSWEEFLQNRRRVFENPVTLSGAKLEFQAISQFNRGHILFSEFCAYYLKRFSLARSVAHEQLLQAAVQAHLDWQSYEASFHLRKHSNHVPVSLPPLTDPPPLVDGHTNQTAVTKLPDIQQLKHQSVREEKPPADPGAQESLAASLQPRISYLDETTPKSKATIGTLPCMKQPPISHVVKEECDTSVNPQQKTAGRSPA